MKLLHSSSCKGPPLGCERGYWLITVILSIAALLEGSITGFLANSSAGPADATHMGVHGIFYGSILYLGFRTKKKRLSARDEVTIRLRYARCNILILFIFLAYLVFVEALPKIWNPTVVLGSTMILGVMAGISGTLVALVILWQMGKKHGGDIDNKECDRGRKSSHKVLFLDAIGDLAISFAILAAAVGIWIDPRRSWLDPSFTFIAAFVIVWQAFSMLRSLQQDEATHNAHKHFHS